MLDVETKRRIDTARDILVGKVPDPKSQVEQITIALIYKFMDDMDMESEELGGERSFFKGEFEKYAWHRIFDPRMGGFEILNLYSEAILKMNVNPNIPQLFRDIFKNAYLPYRDPETLKAFLKIIHEFTYDHSERLGDAFEYLLSVLGSQGEAGQFRTPRHIIDFMVAIIDPRKDEVILDPACGTAGFLISSYKHIIKNNSTNYDPKTDIRIFETKDLSLSEIVINSKNYKGDKLTPDERSQLANNIKGYDISPDMVRLSLVNMYLHGLLAPFIYEYDTLTSEDNWNEYADVILANPPFMSPKGGIRPHKRFSISSNRSEVLFVDYIAEHLTSNGKAAVIVPEGIIFQSGTAYKILRKMLVENFLVGVISLPAGVFQPYSGVKTSILWLDRTLAKKTDKILFIKIENDGFDLGAQRKPVKLNDLPYANSLIIKYKSQTTSGNVDENELFKLVDKSAISKSGDYNLSGDRYSISLVVSTKYDFKPLDQLCEFNNGLWKGKKEPFITAKVIRNTNFRNDGFIDWSDIAVLDVEKKQFENRELKCGDIIIEKSGGGPTQPVGRVVFFNKSEKGFSYSNFTSIIRVVDESLNSQFLWLILRDFYYKGKTEQYQQRTSGIRNLNFKLYQKIVIPLPPLPVQKEIVAEIESYQKIIDGARQVVENYKPRIDIDLEWKIVHLGEVAEFKNGLNYRRGERGEKYKIIGVRHFQDYLIAPIHDLDDVQLDKEISADYLLKEGDLLFVRSNGNLELVGRSILIPKIDQRITFSGFTIRCRFGFDVSPLFYAYLFKTEYFRIILRNVGRGANIRNLTQGILSEIRVPKPKINSQLEIVSKLENEEKLILSNQNLIKLYEQKIKDRIAKVWGE